MGSPPQAFAVVVVRVDIFAGCRIPVQSRSRVAHCSTRPLDPCGFHSEPVNYVSSRMNVSGRRHVPLPPLLQDNVKPFPTEVAVRQIEAELGRQGGPQRTATWGEWGWSMACDCSIPSPFLETDVFKGLSESPVPSSCKVVTVHCLG